MLKKIKIDYGRCFGSIVFDKNTQMSFIDMLNHYSSIPLGYNHPVFRSTEFLNDIIRVGHVKSSVGIYDSDEYQEFLQHFRTVVPSAYSKIHFACTGSLAVEAAIKTAWMVNDNSKKQRIIVVKNSFHGLNSLGNFVTYRGEYLNNRLNNIPTQVWGQEIEINELLGNNSGIFDTDVSSVLIEPIQCTYGDKYLNEKYLQLIIEECKLRKIPVIFDEVQTGFGATGRWWYFQHLGVEPDIVIFGKKSQVSGIFVKDEYADIFKNYDKLSVTFDGDLVDMIRCKYIIDVINHHGLLANISDKGHAIIEGLKTHTILKNVRGIGGIIAFDLDTSEVRDIVYKKFFENGILSNPTAHNTIRIRPSLNITDQEVTNFLINVRRSLESII